MNDDAFPVLIIAKSPLCKVKKFPWEKTKNADKA